MPKGVTKRRPETRARLLEAAIEAFAELGYGGATIDEICRRAGYTTGAYYSNFASKDELFFALFDEHATQTIEQFVRPLQDLGSNSLSPAQIASSFAAIGPDERRWFLLSTEFNLYAIRNPAAARMLAERDARVYTELAAALSIAFDKLGVQPPADLRRLAQLVVAIREGGLMQSLVDSVELPPGTLEREFLPLLFGADTHPAGATVPQGDSPRHET